MKNTISLLSAIAISLFMWTNATAQWVVGTTDTGGVNHLGSIVKIPYGFDTVQYTYSMTGGLNGNKPRSLVRACDGTLYGIADGGLNNHGILFSFNPNTNVFTKKIDLHASNCWYPIGIAMGSNGKIYGSTQNTPQAYFFEYNIGSNTIVKRDSTSRYYFPYNINSFVTYDFTTPFVGKNNKLYYGTPSATVYDQNNNLIGGGSKIIQYNTLNNTIVKIDSTVSDEAIRSVTESSDSSLYVEIVNCCFLNATTVYKNGFQNSEYLAQNYYTSAHHSPLCQGVDGNMYAAFAGGFQCYSDISIYKFKQGFADLLSNTILSAIYTTGEYSSYCQVYKMPDGNIYFATNEGADFCGAGIARIGHMNHYTNSVSQMVTPHTLNSMVYAGKDFLGKDITKTILPNQKCNLTKINLSPELSFSYRKNNWAVMTTPSMAVAGTYYLVATSNTGCVDTQKVVVKYGANAGMRILEEQPSEETTALPAFYPNPVHDWLNVEIFSAESHDISIQIYDMEGRMLNQVNQQVSEGTQTITVETKNLKSGMYLLRVIENGELTSVNKIIKE